MVITADVKQKCSFEMAFATENYSFSAYKILRHKIQDGTHYAGTQFQKEAKIFQRRNTG